MRLSIQRNINRTARPRPQGERRCSGERPLSFPDETPTLVSTRCYCHKPRPALRAPWPRPLTPPPRPSLCREDASPTREQPEADVEMLDPADRCAWAIHLLIGGPEASSSHRSANKKPPVSPPPSHQCHPTRFSLPCQDPRPQTPLTAGPGGVCGVHLGSLPAPGPQSSPVTEHGLS